jgi:hypothetical protein
MPAPGTYDVAPLGPRVWWALADETCNSLSFKNPIEGTLTIKSLKEATRTEPFQAEMDVSLRFEEGEVSGTIFGTRCELPKNDYYCSVK